MSTDSPSELRRRIRDAVVDGDAPAAAAGVAEALGDALEARAILDASLVPAMDEAGRRFEAHEYLVPELLCSARSWRR